MDYNLEQWHWWAACLTFMVIAAVVRRKTWALWVTAGSGILGAVSWLTPETPAIYQLMLFFLIVLGGMTFSEVFSKPNPNRDQGDVPEEVRQAGERYINKVITLELPIVNGYGSVVIDGVEWRLRGEDSVVGQQVIVLDADGIDRDVLIVERVEDRF